MCMRPNPAAKEIPGNKFKVVIVNDEGDFTPPLMSSKTFYRLHEMAKSDRDINDYKYEKLFNVIEKGFHVLHSVADAESFIKNWRGYSLANTDNRNHKMLSSRLAILEVEVFDYVGSGIDDCTLLDSSVYNSIKPVNVVASFPPLE